MKLRLSASGAASAFSAAAVARTFCALTLDEPLLPGGRWLAALLGGVLAAPVVLGIARAKGRGLAGAILMPLGALEAAQAARTLAHGASFLAFDRVPTALLMLPLFLAALRCLWPGGTALGAASRVWLKLLPLFLVPILALQLPHLEPDWLFPLLGSGPRSILGGAIRAAGGFAMLSGLWLVAEDGDGPPHPLRCLAFSALLAAALLAAQEMMAPVMISADSSRVFLLDALLTNGRAPLILQLPMVIVWFIAMLNLLAVQCFLSAALASRLAARANPRIVGIAVVAVVAALALAGLPGWRRAALLGRMELAAAGLCAAIFYAKSGGERPCARES